MERTISTLNCQISQFITRAFKLTEREREENKKDATHGGLPFTGHLGIHARERE
jgi:hypothetical protein